MATNNSGVSADTMIEKIKAFNTEVDALYAGIDTKDKKTVDILNKHGYTPESMDEYDLTAIDALNQIHRNKIEDKIIKSNDFSIKQTSDRDVIVSKIAENVGKDKKGYEVTMELRQDGIFGIDDPHIDPNLINYESKDKTRNSIIISKSQYDAIAKAAGDNVVQDGKITHMAVSGDLVKPKCSDERDIGLMVDPKTVKSATMPFNEASLKNHQEMGTFNQKWTNEIQIELQEYFDEANAYKRAVAESSKVSDLNARFAGSAQTVDTPETKTDELYHF